MSQNKYDKAVAEARRLVRRSEEDQWRLAELTWQQVEAGKSRRQWAKDIGVAASWAQALYNVWASHGDQHADHRPRFAEAARKVHTPGRAADTDEFGSTHQAEARQVVRNLPPERKAEVARELLADNEVASQVTEDPAARQAVTRALDDHYESTSRRSQPKLDTARDAHADALALIMRLRTAHRALAEAMGLAQDIRGIGSDDLRDGVRDEIRWMRMAIDAIEIGAGGGSIDDQLAELLDSENGR